MYASWKPQAERWFYCIDYSASGQKAQQRCSFTLTSQRGWQGHGNTWQHCNASSWQFCVKHAGLTWPKSVACGSKCLNHAYTNWLYKAHWKSPPPSSLQGHWSNLPATKVTRRFLCMHYPEATEIAIKLQLGGAFITLESCVLASVSKRAKTGKVAKLGLNMAQHRPNMGPTWAQHRPTWPKMGPTLPSHHLCPNL